MDQPPQPVIQWNDALEQLICNEAEKASGLSWLHNKAEAHYSRLANFLQIPVIVLSTITGFLSGATIEGLPNIALGAISISVGVLGTINSYFGFQRRAEGHKLGATQYSAIHKTLAIEMSLPRTQRQPPKVLLKLIKDELARLAEILPRIPDGIILLYKKEIISKSQDVEHPEITNGIHAVSAFSSPTPPQNEVVEVKDAKSGVVIKMEV